MRARLGLAGVVAWVVAVGVLGTGCGKSHRASSDSGTSDQSVMVDGDVAEDGGRACEGGSGALPIIPPQSECRTSFDCSDGMLCFGASDPFCGACPQPMRACEDDGDCTRGSWCRASQPSCCGGRDTTCVPDCGPMVACPTGEICDSMTGRCERNGCLALDAACPENQECDPERPDADALGCVRRNCDVDSDCDCGFCVTGTCEARLGFCSLPPP